MYLSTAYQNALDNMPKMTWLDCCTSAINELSKYGHQHVSNPRSITRWNIMFRSTCQFINPVSNQEVDPPLFQLYPEIKKNDKVLS